MMTILYVYEYFKKNMFLFYQNSIFI